MQILPKTIITQLNRLYRKKFDLRTVLVDLTGTVTSTSKHEPVMNLPIMKKARMDAMQEAIRWGEVQTFYITPGILSWIVPIVDGNDLLGGLSGGEVLAQQEAKDLNPAIRYLTEAGCSKQAATQYIRSLPQREQAQIRQAADYLFTELYQHADFSPRLLTRHREHALQQREIAERIHLNKATSARHYSYDEEQALFSLIRVGDKPGARNLLNKLLADMFLNSPNATMVQARAIEMMGYLVRVALEDSPILSTMLNSHAAWTQRILAAQHFESLCWELREILDEFMNTIFRHGYNRSNKRAQEILDYMAEHFTEPLSLKNIGEAVGLSHYRVAHLVKEATGKTVVQHLKLMRIRKAQELLMHTEMSYIDIAYTLGFSDQSYFIKQFREITGTTPARYRQGS